MALIDPALAQRQPILLHRLRILTEREIAVGRIQRRLAIARRRRLLRQRGHGGDILGRLGRHRLQQLRRGRLAGGQLAGRTARLDDRLGFGKIAGLLGQLGIGLVIALARHRAIGGLQAIEVQLDLRVAFLAGQIVGQRRTPFGGRRIDFQPLAIEAAHLIPVIGLIGHGDGAVIPGGRDRLTRCLLLRQRLLHIGAGFLGLVLAHRDVGAQHGGVDARIAQRLGIIELRHRIGIVRDHVGQIAGDEAQARRVRLGHRTGLEHVGQRDPLSLDVPAQHRHLETQARRGIGLHVGGRIERGDAQIGGRCVTRLDRGFCGLHIGAEGVRHLDRRTCHHDLLLGRSRRRQHGAGQHDRQSDSQKNRIPLGHDRPPPLQYPGPRPVIQKNIGAQTAEPATICAPYTRFRPWCPDRSATDRRSACAHRPGLPRTPTWRRHCRHPWSWQCPDGC